ncbi:MAG: Flp family type IVb pilin [Caldilineaceae bacterium]|nr:Flp family type IVb pilin [Caldilineaceae bacterium]
MYTLATQLVSLYKLYFPTANNEEGQGMVEYALIIALIALGIVGVFASGMTDAFSGFFSNVANEMGLGE